MSDDSGKGFLARLWARIAKRQADNQKKGGKLEYGWKARRQAERRRGRKAGRQAEGLKTRGRPEGELDVKAWRLAMIV